MPIYQLIGSYLESVACPNCGTGIDESPDMILEGMEYEENCPCGTKFKFVLEETVSYFSIWETIETAEEKQQIIHINQAIEHLNMGQRFFWKEHEQALREKFNELQS